MTGRLFGRDQKGPQEVSFCPVKPANDQYITEEEYRQRRNAATEAEMGRLKASPEYKRWVGKRRRERVTYALTSASTMRAVAMLVIAAAAFWAGQITPPSALPEILQPSLAPAEPYLSAQAQSELQLQLEIEQGLANGYSSRVERLSARIASLQTEHAAELRDMRREVQTEHAARFQDMRSQLETEHAAELQDMRSRLEAEHAAGLQDMRSQLERLQTRLAHAQEANPPSSVLSATNLCIVLALLAATSAATFWFSAERYAKEQLQEIEDLRLEAEAREAKLIQEKSMIGRLQNELVRVNSQVGELDTQLERMKRAEAECERLKTRVASLEAAQQGAENALGAANSKVARLTARLQEREEQLTEASDCYEKLNAIYQGDKADGATVLAAKEKAGSELRAVHAMEQAQRQEEVQRLQTQVQQLQAERQQEVKKVESQVQELTARLQEREEQITEAADCYEKLNAIYLADKADAATVLAATEQAEGELRVVHAMEQAERQQEVEKLQSRVQQLQAEHQQEVQKLGAEVEKMNKLDAEAKRLADENNDMDLKIDELTHDKGVFQAEAKRLAADVKRLANDKDGLDCLVGGMQAQIDELSHNKGLLEAEVKRLKPLVRLEKDTVEALQIAMEEARAKHERKVDKLKAGIQQLEDENDGLDGLIHEMRPQIKELSHDKGLLQEEVKRLKGLVEALQSAMEEAEQSEGVPDSQALPVLTSGSASEDSPRSPVLCLKGDEDQQQQEPGHQTLALRGTDAAAALVPKEQAERELRAIHALEQAQRQQEVEKLQRQVQHLEVQHQVEVEMLQSQVQELQAERQQEVQMLEYQVQESQELQEDQQQEPSHQTLALHGNDSFYQEQASALTIIKCKLEDKHKDTLLCLREKEDQMRHMQTLIHQLEDEADRNNAAIGESGHEIDALLNQIAEQQEQIVRLQEQQTDQLANRGDECLRLERLNENLEGQVEQLTISLMDATSKKTDGELRLRQFQQELVEMEMLMARAEQERGALERELRAMRGNASEAASHLHIAQAELRRQSVGRGLEIAAKEAQDRPSVPVPGPVQSPITRALGIMQKMEGANRAVPGSESPNYSSPASKTASGSQRASPADGAATARPQSALRNSSIKDDTVRSIDFLTSSNLGRLQEESSAQREVAPQDSPVNSPVRMAQQPLTLIDEASAAVSSEMRPTADMERALRQQDARFASLEHDAQEASGSADGAPDLAVLHNAMHTAYKMLARETAALAEARQAASGAAQSAQSADDSFMAAQEALQRLTEERFAAEQRFGAATAHVIECTAVLATAEEAAEAAGKVLKEFEARGLGAFGGGEESMNAWGKRIEAQDAFAGAAQAKSDALQAKESALLAKRAALAQQEAAVLAVSAQEASASAAAEAAQQALQHLQAHAKASGCSPCNSCLLKAALQAQKDFLDATAAFSARLATLSPESPQQGSAITNDSSAASKVSSATLLESHALSSVSQLSADSEDSPGSVENQPQRANLRPDRLSRQGSLKGLLGGLTFNKRIAGAAKSSQARQEVSALRAKSETSAVLGERHGNSLVASRRSTDALALLDTAWFSHSGAYD